MSRVDFTSAVYGHDSTEPLPFGSGTNTIGHRHLAAYAVFGVLVGPVFIACLILLPIAIISWSMVAQSTIALWIGIAILSIHIVAMRSLLKVRRIASSRRRAVAVKAAEAPALFALLARQCHDLEIAPVKRVYVSTELNASVAQVPRCFGVAGYRHVLTVGLPLLQSVTHDELAAILAHELAHCRRGDGHRHRLVHRVRQQWQRLEVASASGNFLGATALKRLSRWYVSRFDAVAGRTLRMGEFEADAIAAQLAGREAMAHALVRTHRAQEVLSRAWEALWLENVQVAKPHAGPWSRFSLLLPSAMATQVFGVRDGIISGTAGSQQQTHPSLTDRLARLELPQGWVARMEAVVTTSAASLLGAAEAQITSHFDRAWWRENRDRWTTFHAGVEAQRLRLQVLDEAALRGNLPLETALERAHRAEYLLGEAAALERYHWCVARYPAAPEAFSQLGDLLMKTGDPSAEMFLAHARTLQT